MLFSPPDPTTISITPEMVTIAKVIVGLLTAIFGLGTWLLVRLMNGALLLAEARKALRAVKQIPILRQRSTQLEEVVSALTGEIRKIKDLLGISDPEVLRQVVMRKLASAAIHEQVDDPGARRYDPEGSGRFRGLQLPTEEPPADASKRRLMTPFPTRRRGQDDDNDG